MRNTYYAAILFPLFLGVTEKSVRASACGCVPPCDDGIDCTRNHCDCSNPAAPFCVYPDNCGNSPGCFGEVCNHDTGECEGVVCDDHSVCTDDYCGSDAVCHYDWLCNPSPCYEVTCDPMVGCFDEYVCDDHDACNGQESCQPPAHCEPGTPPDCDDHSDCTRDSCDPEYGCRHEQLCVGGDACVGFLQCVGFPNWHCERSPRPDCNDHNECTRDSCDPNSPYYGCKHEPLNGRRCDDGSACTKDDRCQGSSCVGGPYLDCDDHNACTAPDHCDISGGCVNPEIPCHDADPCTDDKCDSELGCLHVCDANLGDAPEPPEPDDRTFVNPSADSPGLPTLLSPGANSFTINVTRFAGPTDTSTHTLLFGNVLGPAKLAQEFAELRIVSFGVPGGEEDLVSFNGIPVDDIDDDIFENEDFNSPPYLRAAGCSWTTTFFRIPLNRVKFPDARGANGAAPTPQANNVRIDVQGGAGCRKIRWMSLSVKLMSPIVLIHGNNSNPGFWFRQEFFNEMQPIMVVDATIQLPTAPIIDNGALLAAKIPQTATEFGVDSLHLVGHSKGGLDLRRYLASSYRENRSTSPLLILSLTTLATPHNGTVLADIGKAVEQEASAALELQNQPLLMAKVAELAGVDAATPDLRNTNMLQFNFDNLYDMPTDAVYNVIAAEADTNGNWRIDNTPDEYSALRTENAGLRGVYNTLGPATARLAVDRYMYQVLRNTRFIVLEEYSTWDQEEGVENPDEQVSVVRFKSIKPPLPENNDCLVPYFSAKGLGYFWHLMEQSGGSVDERIGANHASVANNATGNIVSDWLVSIERKEGDLR